MILGKKLYRPQTKFEDGLPRFLSVLIYAALCNRFSILRIASGGTPDTDRSGTSSPSAAPNGLLNTGGDDLMSQLLRGEATEFVEQSEKAIEEDPIYTGWDITLKNCQVFLKGHENTGCMCLTADNMKWVRHEYQRAWRDGQYLDKFRLKGQLNEMQLFSLSNFDSLEGAVWVPNDQIHQEFSPDLDPPENAPGVSNYIKIVHPCSVTVNYISY